MISFPNKKNLIWILVGIILLAIAVFAYFYFTTEKSLKLVWPSGEEKLRAGNIYQISWEAKKIGKIGILLIKEDKKESKWIVRDFPAGNKKYDWQVFVWEEPREDYKISILEYPWQEGNKIDYSDKRFTILGPHFASCDQLSIETEWPFISSDVPNLRKVFLTEKNYSGNLGGLEGADKICQQEAEAQGFKGNWKAFLGDDALLAVDRLNLDGVFVLAKGEVVLPQEKVPAYLWGSFEEFLKKTRTEEKKETVEDSLFILEKYFERFVEEWEGEQDRKTCHRLLGENFDEFFKKLSQPLSLNQEKFDEDFLRNFSRIWLGRINKESKKDCINIFTQYPRADPAFNYSFTTTCKNWKSEEELIPGYPPKPEEKPEFPICYTPEGRRINAIALAGLSSGLVETKEKTQIFNPFLGKPCSDSQKLLCVEQ